MINKEGSVEILNLMTLEAADLALGCDHISHIVSIISFKIVSIPVQKSDNLSIQ